jgi:hypothetical protein
MNAHDDDDLPFAEEIDDSVTGRLLRGEVINTLGSTCIDWMQYDRKVQRLTVQFEKSGAVYAYGGVEEGTAISLAQAPSHGQYFVHHIRNAHYSYARQ